MARTSTMQRVSLRQFADWDQQEGLLEGEWEYNATMATGGIVLRWDGVDWCVTTLIVTKYRVQFRCEETGEWVTLSHFEFGRKCYTRR